MFLHRRFPFLQSSVFPHTVSWGPKSFLLE
jgi:hypothetical protein